MQHIKCYRHTLHYQRNRSYFYSIRLPLTCFVHFYSYLFSQKLFLCFQTWIQLILECRLSQISSWACRPWSLVSTVRCCISKWKRHPQWCGFSTLHTDVHLISCSSLRLTNQMPQNVHYSIRKVSKHFFFCKNLVDFNEMHLHKATLNLHMHTWIFCYLSIASVDGKQHLSEIVFSALVGFSLYTMSMQHRVKQSPKSNTGMFSTA